MTVYKINRNKLRIYLTDTEVKKGFGGYKSLIEMSKSTKHRLNALLCNIVKAHFEEVNAIKINGKISFFQNSGCYIMLDFITENQNKKTVFKFADGESLINAILSVFKRERAIKSDLYLMKDGYRLIAESCESIFKNKNIKYSVSQNPIDIAYTKEYGKPLIINDAIYLFGKAFFKDF